MATHLPQQRAPQKTEIPDKLYFRIGEVARLCSVAPYVLRFWETEFTQLKPNKSGTGQRLYRRRDVEMALRVKRLLYDEGYTIAGARQAIQAETRSKRGGQPELPLPQQQQAVQRAEARLHKVRKELREILGMLAGPYRRNCKSRSGHAPTPAANPASSSCRATRSTPVETESTRPACLPRRRAEGYRTTMLPWFMKRSIACMAQPCPQR